MYRLGIKFLAVGALVVASLIFNHFANGQQSAATDPATLARIISSLQQQRNTAMDMAAVNEARVVELTQEIEKLKAELAAKAEPKKD